MLGRWIAIVGLIALGGTALSAATRRVPADAAAEPADARPEMMQRAQEAVAAIAARVEAGTADPAADAASAAARGEFGLIVMGRFGLVPPGITCFTPQRQAPAVVAASRHGDVFDERMNRFTTYAQAYNAALVARRDFPDADLCRLAEPGDQHSEWDQSELTRPARPAHGPARNLHEAARRGDAEAMRRFLDATPVDALDGVGMTALAWAMARDRREAVHQLLRAGADPWRGQYETLGSAVYWAAALGRADDFAMLARRRGRPFDQWPPAFLSAALEGGNRTIVARMLRAPHVQVRIDDLPHPLPPAALLEPVLRDSPALASPLLLRGIEQNARLDLVRLALAHGADPNAQAASGGSDTALALASRSIHPSTPRIVDALLRAGADPNRPTHRNRPVWVAVQAIGLSRYGTGAEYEARATAIFHRLVAAGADLRLPNDQGRPPVWVLFFPRRYAHLEMDASLVTPALLELLVANGLDVNAVWQGQRILPMVEAQGGRDAELAAALRRLGARP